MDSGVISIPLDNHGSADPANSVSRNRLLPEFITDAENAIVRVAAESVFAVQAAYNPLVFFGPPATGKTRLARSLVQRWKLLNPGRKLIITNAADFARGYTTATQTSSITELRERYIATDLLLFDELDGLHGKASAQRELAAIVEQLVEFERRVIVTARSLPTSDERISAALASRLSAGLSIPVNPPGQQARRAITMRLAELHDLKCHKTALYKLADGLPSTVLALNRAVAELQATASDSNQSSDHSARIKQLLRKYRLERQPTLQSITQNVCRYFGVKVAATKSSSRRANVVRARSVAMHLTRKLTDLSLEQIGRFFGGRDHTTVLHACRKIEKISSSDPQLSAIVNELTSRILD